MAYVCDLGSGQRISLDGQGAQTIVAISSNSAGQQQQATSSLQTGTWTAPPEVYRTSEGVVVKLQTANGTQFIQIQGSRMGMVATPPSLTNAEQLPTQQTNVSDSTMQPMKPMQPMNMGTMQMNLKPMEMKMGDMEMRMGSASADSINAAKPAPTRQFCTQCGASIKPSDRFCASCGHQIV
ncbi:MAG: zinc ribbon domain-containing protein [Leptolyngbya sp.]|nr:MAG: zinc ribbon domain-containing protein [Leptolyngbya sp.]